MNDQSFLLVVFTTGNAGFAFVVGRKIPTTAGTSGNYYLDEPVISIFLDEPVINIFLDEPVINTFLSFENLETIDFLTDNFCEVVMILILYGFLIYL